MPDTRAYALGDIAEVTVGGTPSKAKPEFWQGGIIPWMSSGEVNKLRVRQVDGAITQLGLDNSSAKMVQPPTIAMALAGQGRTRGTVAFVECATSTNQSVALIKVNEDIADPWFVFFNLQGRYDELRGLSTGDGGRGGLNKSLIEGIMMQLPALDEQRRIAALLRSVDAGLHSATQVAKQSLRVARDMFDAFHEVAKAPMQPLSALCIEPGRYGANAPARQHDPDWPRYIRITDITDDGTLSEVDKKSLEPSDAVPYLLKPHDVVVARTGATVGKAFQYDETHGPCAHAGYLIRFRPDPSRINPEFLGLFMQSRRYWRWVHTMLRDSARPNINAQEYAILPVPVPSPEVQDALVQAVTACFDSSAANNQVARAKQNLKQGLFASLLAASSALLVPA
jgi:type I restriction enzyme, S subunit